MYSSDPILKHELEPHTHCYVCRSMLSSANTPYGCRIVSRTSTGGFPTWSSLSVVQPRQRLLGQSLCSALSLKYQPPYVDSRTSRSQLLINFSWRLNKLGMADGTYRKTLVDIHHCGYRGLPGRYLNSMSGRCINACSNISRRLEESYSWWKDSWTIRWNRPVKKMERVFVR